MRDGGGLTAMATIVAAMAAMLTLQKGAATKKGKPAKDPNKPKRPPSAFFVFMEDFRVTYKQKHPNNNSVAIVGKAGGEKWKSLTDEEKAPFIQKAEKRKADYEKSMNTYNKKLRLGNSYPFYGMSGITQLLVLVRQLVWLLLPYCCSAAAARPRIAPRFSLDCAHLVCIL